MPANLKANDILKLIMRQIQARSKSDANIHRDWNKRFRTFDINHDAVVSPTELGHILRDHFSMDFSERQLRELFHHVDVDGGGTLDSAELSVALLQAYGTAGPTSLVALGQRSKEVGSDARQSKAATPRSARVRVDLRANQNHSCRLERHPEERRYQESTNTSGRATQDWLEASRKATGPRGGSKGPQRAHQTPKFDHLAKDKRGNGYGHTRERLIRGQAWTQPPSSRGPAAVVETEFQRLVSPVAQQAKNSPLSRGDVGRNGEDTNEFTSTSPMWGHLKSSHENTRHILAGGRSVRNSPAPREPTRTARGGSRASFGARH
jgi:hypothetical protein